MDLSGVSARNSLLQYADTSLWANPDIDSQYQLQLNRISDDLGYLDYFVHMRRYTLLPTSGEFYHVFNLSGTSVGYWNLKERVSFSNPFNRWVNLAQMCTKRGLYADFYNKKGLIFPRGLTWIMVRDDGTALLAIKKLENWDVVSYDKMYLRTYTNYGTATTGEEAYESTNSIKYDYMIYTSVLEIKKFYAKWKEWKKLSGNTLLFINGALVKEFPNLDELAVNATVELCFDPNVTHIEYYSINSLPEFDSTKDGKTKYIVHPPKRTITDRIRYFDDCDFYLVNTKTGNGLYYHRNSADAVRQLTHVDYSIAGDYIQYLSDQHVELDNLKADSIMIVHRKTDWQVDLPDEHQRINYLYRLTDAQIIEAMTGTNSLVPEWTAAQLEASKTIEVLRTQFKNLTPNNVALALGYNAMTKVNSNSPIMIDGSIQEYIKPPYSYRKSSVVFNYDENGLLLDYHQMYNCALYTPTNTATKMVEFVMGTGGDQVNAVIGTNAVKLDTNLSYRVYTCGWLIDKGEPNDKWVDVTGDDSVYSVEDGYLNWKINKRNKTGLVLFNDKFLLQEFEIDHIDKITTFEVTHIWKGGGIELPVKPAQIDVFMNGYSLMENIDYVIDYPRIYVFNKQHRVEGAQKFVLRAHGLAPLDDSPIYDTELGFLSHGMLGLNTDRYNVRDDRVTRIVVGGCLLHPSQINNAELYKGNGKDFDHTLNGMPYMVKHVFAPVVESNLYDNYYLYDVSRELDYRVCSYLTEYLPKYQPTKVPVLTTDKYRIYSLFMTSVIMGIYNKIIVIPDLKDGATKYSDQAISEILKDYIWWLKYDPITLGYDVRYITLHPHTEKTIAVSSKEFTFINQVNVLYMKSRCIIEGHLEVQTNV